MRALLPPGRGGAFPPTGGAPGLGAFVIGAASEWLSVEIAFAAAGAF